jgi:predicted amidohydrolase
MIITSQSRASHRAREIRVARDQAIKHGTPTVFCASSSSTNDTDAADGSSSALIDPWGNILFQQMGGETWSLNTAIEYEYQTGLGRSMTGYEFLGDL